MSVGVEFVVGGDGVGVALPGRALDERESSTTVALSADGKIAQRIHPPMPFSDWDERDLLLPRQYNQSPLLVIFQHIIQLKRSLLAPSKNMAPKSTDAEEQRIQGTSQLAPPEGLVVCGGLWAACMPLKA